MKLNELSPAALKAAMQGGTEAWGSWGSALEHIRYMEPQPANSRRRCPCGCRKRATHLGMANGVGLISGCEPSMLRWVAAGKKQP